MCYWEEWKQGDLRRRAHQPAGVPDLGEDSDAFCDMSVDAWESSSPDDTAYIIVFISVYVSQRVLAKDEATRWSKFCQTSVIPGQFTHCASEWKKYH